MAAGEGSADTYAPYSAKNDSSAVRIAAMFVLPSLDLAFSWKRRKFGMAMAARIPMMATTIISSMSVKPPRRVWSFVTDHFSLSLGRFDPVDRSPSGRTPAGTGARIPSRRDLEQPLCQFAGGGPVHRQLRDPT